MSLVFFANDKYKMLQIIYDNKLLIGSQYVTPLSQESLSQIAQMSKPKVNKIIHELKDMGYLKFAAGKGKYTVTEKGERAIKIFREEQI